MTPDEQLLINALAQNPAVLKVAANLAQSKGKTITFWDNARRLLATLPMLVGTYLFFWVCRDAILALQVCGATVPSSVKYQMSFAIVLFLILAFMVRGFPKNLTIGKM